MTVTCASVRIEGYRSIQDTTLELSEDVTLLIGANGSGKSNIIGALELLGRVIDNRFDEHLIRQGGLRAQLHSSARGDDAQSVRLEVRSRPQASAKHSGAMFVNGYDVTLTADDEGTTLLREGVSLHNIDEYEFPKRYPRPLARRSVLREEAEQPGPMRPVDHIVALVSGVRVFHVDDTGPAAPALQRVDIADDMSVHDDGSNVAAVLLRLKNHDAARYERIVRAVRVVAPFFEDFVLEPQDGFVQLRWRQYGLDRVFHGRFLSSGTLRFISLAVVLLQDRRPGVIVLDEPELGLHPAAIAQAAQLMRVAAREAQIVAATQSTALLNHFAVDNIVVVDRQEGQTTAGRPDVKQLEVFLDDYTTGEMWEMSLLGAGPRPDHVVSSGATA